MNDQARDPDGSRHALAASEGGGWQTPAERKAAERRRQRRKDRRMIRAGQAVMATGVIVAVVHVFAHLQVFSSGQPSGFVDLVAGYPMAGALFVIGAILAGR